MEIVMSVLKYMTFNINDKLIFIGSFQILRSPLGSLVKYLSQEFDTNVLVMQKGFYPYHYMSGFEKLGFDRMKDKTTSLAIKESAGLKLRMYSFLVDDSSEHKKQRV